MSSFYTFATNMGKSLKFY